MKNIIKKLLKIKCIKVLLCMFESIIKSIHPKIWVYIEKKIYNPYDFGDENIKHSKKLYEKILQTAQIYDFNIKDKNLLELGPGGFLGVGAFLKTQGLKRYYVIDDVNHFEQLDKKTIDLYKKIDASILKGDKFDQTYVKQLTYKKDNTLPLKDKSIDFVFSNAVYEHVKDPESSIKELARITKKGGLSMHTIDFRDHIFNQKSLFFLTLPDVLFNTLFKNSGAWVNRKRYSDFVKYFKNNGFEILKITINKKFSTATQKKYKNILTKKYPIEDLNNASATFICRKK